MTKMMMMMIATTKTTASGSRELRVHKCYSTLVVERAILCCDARDSEKSAVTIVCIILVVTNNSKLTKDALL